MNAVRSELLKLFTTRLWWGMALAVLVVSAAFAALFGYFITSEIPAAEQGIVGDEVQQVTSVYTAGLSVAYVLIMVLGILSVGQEYRHSTITGTFLAVPRRTRAMLAKVAALVVIGVVYGLISLAGGMSAGIVVLTLGDADPFPSGDLVRNLALALLVLALWALIGLGAGILFKNQIVAVLVMVGLTFLVEPIAGIALQTWDFTREYVAPFMPGAASSAAVAGVTPSEDVGLLLWWQGALVLAAYAAVLSVIGILLTRRRDIT